jgi:myo-inositol-1(or 4)-monophosphatase
VESLDELLETAIEAARRGGEILRGKFRTEGLQIRAKADHDWVSEADQQSEAAIVETLLGRFPDHEVLAEEGGRQGDSDSLWVIDPLDGTTNYLRGLPTYCVSIACRRGGETVVGVVLEPEREALFTAMLGRGAAWNGRPLQVSGRQGIKGAFLATGFPFRSRPALDRYLSTFHDVFVVAGGVRRCGAAALDLAYTAAGIYDGFWEFRLSPWDIAAGALLVEEAGGRVTDLDGGAGYLDGGNVVGGTPGVQEGLLRILRDWVSEEVLDQLVPPKVTGWPPFGLQGPVEGEEVEVC